MSNPHLSEHLINQLEELSLTQLLEIKSKVDYLIANKSVVFQSSNKPSAKPVKWSAIVPECSQEWESYKEWREDYYRYKEVNPTSLKTYEILKKGEFQEKFNQVRFPSVIIIDSKKSMTMNLPEQEQEEIEDDSIEKALGLVDKWLKEDSTYDEENYPQIERGLQENRAFI